MDVPPMFLIVMCSCCPKRFLNQKLSDEHEKSEKAVQKKGHLTDKNFLLIFPLYLVMYYCNHVSVAFCQLCFTRINEMK